MRVLDTVTRYEAGIKTVEQVTAGLFPNPQSPRRAVNAFDAADRLVSATVVGDTNAVEETYLHDLNGAVTNIVSGADTVFSATYDALGQVSVADGQACRYDAIGNRVEAGGRIWVPDHADPLKRPLVEADANGNPIRYYIWSGGRLLGFISAADDSLTVAHCDEQGSIIALTDASGNVLHRACYGPYGEDWGSSGTNPTPFAWLGGYGVQKLPGTDYHIYITRHRLYSATLHRFLSSDPVGLGGGPNLYAYCMDNPLAYIDPLGLCGESGYDQYHSTISADTRPPSSFPTSDRMYSPSSDPDSRALMHADALLPEAAIGTRLGDSMAESMLVQTFTAPGMAIISEWVMGAAGRLLSSRASLPVNEGQLQHIFRNAAGHLDDTPASRQLLLDLADDASTTLGADRFGNVWSARTLNDGSQIWVQTRNGVIQNGGVNATVRTFNSSTGLSGAGGN